MQILTRMGVLSETPPGEYSLAADRILEIDWKVADSKSYLKSVHIQIVASIVAPSSNPFAGSPLNVHLMDRTGSALENPSQEIQIAVSASSYLCLLQQRRPSLSFRHDTASAAPPHKSERYSVLTR
jgi:hypothetical protein